MITCDYVPELRAILKQIQGVDIQLHMGTFLCCDDRLGKIGGSGEFNRVTPEAFLKHVCRLADGEVPDRFHCWVDDQGEANSLNYLMHIFGIHMIASRDAYQTNNKGRLGWTCKRKEVSHKSTQLTPVQFIVASIKRRDMPSKTEMTEKAKGFTREQLIAVGWTEGQLVEHGYIFKPQPPKKRKRVSNVKIMQSVKDSAGIVVSNKILDAVVHELGVAVPILAEFLKTPAVKAIVGVMVAQALKMMEEGEMLPVNLPDGTSQTITTDSLVQLFQAIDLTRIIGRVTSKIDAVSSAE